MEIFVAPRQGGKTTTLLQWVVDAPQGTARVLVSPTERESNRLVRESRTSKAFCSAEEWQFVSWEKFTRSGTLPLWATRSFERFEYAIDNLDAIIQQMVLPHAHSIGLVTWTSEGLLIRHGDGNVEALQTAHFHDEQSPRFETHVVPPRDAGE